MAGRLDGTELDGLLDDLTTGSNIHPGIHHFAAFVRAIAEDQTLDVSGTQLVLAQLCGNADTDAVTIIGALTAWLTDPATNPALHQLPEEARKTIQHQGELAAFELADPDARIPAATASDVLAQPREELSKKVADANKRSQNRPR
ncbi:hypothetical protein ACPCTG_31800 [Streptomyces pseudogriseolus]|uniref:hypothetical protein n=1 Tax=Streptomyces pseudogriseolus TaxID=36817 RepID=UPI003FA27215